MDIATQPNLIFIHHRILENNGIFLRLKLQFDYFPIRFKKPDILDEMVFFHFMGIIDSPYPYDDTIFLLPIKRDMAGFLFGDCFRMGEFLDVYRCFYKTILFGTTMRTYPIFIQIFESGSRENIFLSNKWIIYIRTSATGKFLHKTGQVLRWLNKCKN